MGLKGIFPSEARSSNSRERHSNGAKDVNLAAWKAKGYGVEPNHEGGESQLEDPVFRDLRSAPLFSGFSGNNECKRDISHTQDVLAQSQLELFCREGPIWLLLVEKAGAHFADAIFKAAR